jgi:hypothetical protein
MRRVGAEQAVQCGRAGAWQTGDEDRPLDRDVVVQAGEGQLAEQACDQRAAQLGTLDLVAEPGEPLVARVRIEQYAERFEVLVRAEVGQAGQLRRGRVQIFDRPDRVAAVANGGTPRSSHRGSAR